MSCRRNLYARWQARQEHVEGAKVVHQPVQAQPRDRLTLNTIMLNKSIGWLPPGVELRWFS